MSGVSSPPLVSDVAVTPSVRVVFSVVVVVVVVCGTSVDVVGVSVGDGVVEIGVVGKSSGNL